MWHLTSCAIKSPELARAISLWSCTAVADSLNFSQTDQVIICRRLSSPVVLGRNFLANCSNPKKKKLGQVLVRRADFCAGSVCVESVSSSSFKHRGFSFTSLRREALYLNLQVSWMIALFGQKTSAKFGPRGSLDSTSDVSASFE